MYRKRHRCLLANHLLITAHFVLVISYGVGPSKNTARHIAANETLRILIPDYDESLVVIPKVSDMVSDTK